MSLDPDRRAKIEAAIRAFHERVCDARDVLRSLDDVLDIAPESPLYEAAAQGHHHHFQCTRCRRVFDIPGCPGELIGLTPPGFSVESHEITLYGQCSDCGLHAATMAAPTGGAAHDPGARCC